MDEEEELAEQEIGELARVIRRLDRRVDDLEAEVAELRLSRSLET